MLGRNVDKEEKEFAIQVLAAVYRVFNKHEMEYLTPTRLVKLICIVADDTDFNLTKGWYRHGEYSYAAYRVVKDIGIDRGSEIVVNIPVNILNSVKRFKEIFLVPHDIFYKWIYEKRAPEEYRALYIAHRNFEILLNKIINLMTSKKDIPEELFWNIRKELAVIELNLDHVNDEEILELFYKFTDIFQRIITRIKRYGYNNDSIIALRRLREIYCHMGQEDDPQGRYDLWTMLVPYLQTLRGKNVEKEKEEYKRKVQRCKLYVKSKLEDLEKFINEKGLDVTIDDLRKELKEHYQMLSERDKKLLSELL